MLKKVVVLGGDGFCGWPTALYLSRHDYEVAIVDNLSRRNIDNELETDSLTPISSIGVRLSAWKNLTGHNISFFNFDVCEDYDLLRNFLSEWQPDAVIHFAEQRAAPYSMKSPRHKRYTVDNNVNATHNLLCAIVESGLDIHVVHLGTMGVYGYGTAGMEIPEGYLNVKVNVDGSLKDMRILYPANPGSVYHMTKTLDALMFYYYNKNDGLRITDLHQGIVWGTNTEETEQDIKLINRFDYDGDYGTVLNRFLMQSAIGYPLTVHGTGGQTRAFIHIRNTVQCVKIALENPPRVGESVEIFNQATETHTISALAKKIATLTGAEIAYLKNPRNEASKNELRVANEKFVGLGLNMIPLADNLMKDEVDLARKYADRCDPTKILCISKWRNDIQLDSQEEYLRTAKDMKV